MLKSVARSIWLTLLGAIIAFGMSASVVSATQMAASMAVDVPHMTSMSDMEAVVLPGSHECCSEKSVELDCGYYCTAPMSASLALVFLPSTRPNRLTFLGGQTNPLVGDERPPLPFPPRTPDIA